MDDDAYARHFPPALERRLVEAKKWYDERLELEQAISRHGGNAQRNQEDRDEIDRRAAAVLADIVELCERTWGFA